MIPSSNRDNFASGTAKIMDGGTFRDFREIIYKQSGIYFTDNKKNLLETKISRRMSLLGHTSYEQYLQLIKSPDQAKADSKEIYNAITVNETYFFRSQEQLAVLKDIIIPEIIKNKPAGQKNVRIWSAASSTGEEAYTLTMMILEKIKPLYPDVRFEIWASDISDTALESARRGIYNDHAVKEMPQEYLSKYFKKAGDMYEIDDMIKRLVNFSTVNLYDNDSMKSMKNFDLVFCCNVLIYFDLPSKQKVVSSLYEALNKNSYLFIGYSESLHGIPKAFKLVHLPKAMAYKKD